MGRGPGLAPLAVPARRCESCTDLYHPSGNTQRFCVRPSCIELRGDRVAAYLVDEEKLTR